LFLERYEGLKDKETQDITTKEGCFIDLESRVPFTKRC